MNRAFNGFAPDWPVKSIEELTELWSQVPVLSTSAIGAIMHITKNAVVGKAHRLHLPARPSPIRKKGDPKRVVVAEQPDPSKARCSEVRPSPATTAFLARVDRLAQLSPPGPASTECSWPTWGRGRPTHLYCCEQRQEGRAYCPAHSKRAFVPYKPAG